MFNVIFTRSLFSPGGRLCFYFPSPNLVHASYLCLVGLSADSGSPVELPHQNISYFAETPVVLLLIKPSPACCKSWANTLWIRKHGSMFPHFWGGRSWNLYAFTCSVLHLPWSLFDQKQKVEEMVYYKNDIPLVSSDTNAKGSFQVLFCSFLKEDNGMMF